eukprot:PhM_4_TR16686/c0_g1_i1/m.96475
MFNTARARLLQLRRTCFRLTTTKIPPPPSPPSSCREALLQLSEDVSRQDLLSAVLSAPSPSMPTHDILIETDLTPFLRTAVKVDCNNNNSGALTPHLLAKVFNFTRVGSSSSYHYDDDKEYYSKLMCDASIISERIPVSELLPILELFSSSTSTSLLFQQYPYVRRFCEMVLLRSVAEIESVITKTASCSSSENIGRLFVCLAKLLRRVVVVVSDDVQPTQEETVTHLTNSQKDIIFAACYCLKKQEQQLLLPLTVLDRVLVSLFVLGYRTAHDEEVFVLLYRQVRERVIMNVRGKKEELAAARGIAYVISKTIQSERSASGQEAVRTVREMRHRDRAAAAAAEGRLHLDVEDKEELFLTPTERLFIDSFDGLTAETFESDLLRFGGEKSFGQS